MLIYKKEKKKWLACTLDLLKNINTSQMYDGSQILFCTVAFGSCIPEELGGEIVSSNTFVINDSL